MKLCQRWRADEKLGAGCMLEVLEQVTGG